MWPISVVRHSADERAGWEVTDRGRGEGGEGIERDAEVSSTGQGSIRLSDVSNDLAIRRMLCPLPGCYVYCGVSKHFASFVCGQ